MALIVPAPEKGKLDAFGKAVRAAVADYAKRYDAMFARQNTRVGGVKTKLDPLPARGAGAGRRPVRHRQDGQGCRDRR